MNYNMVEEARELAEWSKESEALAIYQALSNIEVSEPTARRGTERAGVLYEARQTRQRQLADQAEAAATACEKQVISTDGAYVPLVKGEWAEVRTVAIGEVQEKDGTRCTCASYPTFRA